MKEKEVQKGQLSDEDKRAAKLFALRIYKDIYQEIMKMQEREKKTSAAMQ